ncbi:MAG: glycosyltransferase [Terriglobales bacterium]
MGATDAANITIPQITEPPTNLFLMVNTLETGGSERQFAVLAEHLAPSRFDVHLGCVHRRGEMADHLGEIPEFPLGGSLYGFQSLRARLDLSRHLRKHQIQVAHGFDFYVNLTMIPAARLARVPIVIGSHRQLGDLMTPAQFRAQATAFRWCDAVVCNSKAGGDRLAADGIAREKLFVIGNALPAAAFETAAPALPPSRSPRVTMVARMNADYKNHAGFLRIAAEVNKRMPDAEFVLAGDGPMRAEIEQQASALGLSSRVVFLGDRRDIPAILASTDVAVLTSVSEGLSNVIIEAFAANLPVVAYDVGGNSELVDNAGQRGALIPAGNESEFAKAVIRLLSDPNLRAHQGSVARQFAEQNFSLARVLGQYEDLYVSLLDEKRQRRRKA